MTATRIRPVDTSSTPRPGMDRLELDVWVCQANIERFSDLLGQCANRREHQRLETLLGREQDWRRELEKARHMRHRLVRLAAAGDTGVAAIFGVLLDDAIEEMAAAMGYIQLMDVDNADLLVVASRGLSDSFLRFFTELHSNRTSGLLARLLNADGVMVEDIRCNSLFIETEAGRMMERAQSMAVLTLPLRLRQAGQTVGMVSTHWRAPTRTKPESRKRLALRIGRAMDELAGLSQ